MFYFKISGLVVVGYLALALAGTFLASRWMTMDLDTEEGGGVIA